MASMGDIEDFLYRSYTDKVLGDIIRGTESIDVRSYECRLSPTDVDRLNEMRTHAGFPIIDKENEKILTSNYKV